ncbi:MAG TPA: hypothetical protein VFJ92_09675, partial [Gemmatimonadales bacterium]|nr:hypothetical protein [Gemmatimonadales bacterium]
AAAQELSSETLQAINTATHARVRLAEPGWHRLAGTGRASSDSTLVYVRGPSASPSLTEVSLREVRELQVARGSNAGKGAFIGGGIGLGLAIVAVLAASSDEWTTPSGGQAVAAMLLNTAAGAGIGALIGSASKHWQTVYRADAP